MPQREYKIISVGGSIIIPKEGFDIKFLRDFRRLILQGVKKGDRFILVVGGGATCRAYQGAAKEVADLSDKDLDWLGIFATWFNAEFVRLLFGDLAHPEVVKNPTNKPITNKPIVVAGGWKPGCSTDRDAVWLAKTYGVRQIINASNIDFVYTADPKTHPEARPIKKISWAEFRKIVGDKWRAGANLPFDPLAAQAAEELDLEVIFVKGTDLRALGRALDGGRIKGTVIQKKLAINQQLAAAQKNLKGKLLELERFNKVAVGRELKMVELKEEIARLKDGTTRDNIAKTVKNTRK